MKKLLTNAQMKEADTQTIESGTSCEILMQRAGDAIASEVEEVANTIANPKILVVCGIGNNGGDGYVCARLLDSWGYNVTVFAFSGKLSDDCQREKAQYVGDYTEEITGDIIVDCIFGTGLCREVASPYKEVIDKINKRNAYVISADIPSGLNGDNGMIMGTAVKANETIAIAQLKRGFYLNDGLDLCGEIKLKDIGISAGGYDCVVVELSDMKNFFPERKRNSNKGTYGSCEIVGGGLYTGAAALALSGAIKTGCGYIKFVCKDEMKNALVAAIPQVVYINNIDLTSKSIAFGMGEGVSEQTYSRLKYLVENYTGKLIIDADGLNCLAMYGLDILKNRKCEILLTPHVKEFSRLLGTTVEDVIANGVELAKNFAKEHGVTIILKSASAVISDGKNTAICAEGNSSLAKGGSGDVLAGFICGVAARGVGLYEAAVCAHFVLGRAAVLASERFTEYCVTHNEVLNFVPAVIFDALKKDKKQ